ncbi:hypothetical protein OKW42_006698 [Paraburkholderia sp. WC7.3d]
MCSKETSSPKTGSAPQALSLTVSFVPEPRVAEIRYRESDGSESSTIELDDASFRHWHAGHEAEFVSSESLPFSGFEQFAIDLYRAVAARNDKRYSKWDDPVLLSMQLCFLEPESDRARVAAIRYLERDGGITLASEIDPEHFGLRFASGEAYCPPERWAFCASDDVYSFAMKLYEEAVADRGRTC